MQAHPDFILQNIGNIYFILPDSKSSFLAPGCMLTTNETGAYLWKQLQKETSLDELTSSLCTLYEIDPASASEDIQSFLRGLSKIGALR